MATIMVQLADEDLDFLRRYSSRHGTSAEELLAAQAHNLRRRMEHPLPDAVTAATGIIREEVDSGAEWNRHRDTKYR